MLSLLSRNQRTGVYAFAAGVLTVVVAVQLLR